MAASGTRVRVALVGLGPNYHRTPEDFRILLSKRLNAGDKLMIDAVYDLEIYPVSPDEGAAALEPKLQLQPPDAVVIGNGVRRNMELTHFMEQIIDTVRTSAPQAKLMFNTSPDRTVDAVQRWFMTSTKSA